MIAVYGSTSSCKISSVVNKAFSYGYNSIAISSTYVRRGNYLRFQGPIAFRVENDKSQTSQSPDYHLSTKKQVQLITGLKNRLELKVNYITTQVVNREIVYNTTRKKYIDPHKISLDGKSSYSSLTLTNAGIFVDVNQCKYRKLTECPRLIWKKQSLWKFHFRLEYRVELSEQVPSDKAKTYMPAKSSIKSWLQTSYQSRRLALSR